MGSAPAGGGSIGPVVERRAVGLFGFAPTQGRWDKIAQLGAVRIGNDVWIGQAAQIMSGVRVGDGAIVGAGAIVTRDVPPYAVVAGNPARLIRYRFDDATIAKLVSTAWWDWDEARLRAESDFLVSLHEAPGR